MLSSLHSMQHDIKPPYDHYSYKHNYSRYSPPESPRQLPSVFAGPEGDMSNHHRGLPAPLGMSLPPPDRHNTGNSMLGNLPAPPSQWSGQDESMRNWLQAKAEEDRRRQEEERTKQETLRLDQRKIEQNMLRDSLQGGIPPPMVPLIFAGMGGGNLPVHTLEWAQTYLSQLSLQNQQQQQQIQQQQIQQQAPPSPDIRRDTRMIPPNPYGAQQQPQASQPPPAPLPAQSRSLVQIPHANGLSRLNTAELPSQTLPSSAPTRQSTYSLQQPQTAQSEPTTGPSLFFHHWTPPSNNTNNNNNNNNNGGPLPPTPSGKSQQGSPYGQHPSSHLRSEYQNSPKKRKLATANSSQPPTSQPMDVSPPSSSHREHSPRAMSTERGHSRHRSDTSSREMDGRLMARPSSRQQRQDERSGAYHHYQSRQYTGSSVSGHNEDHHMR